MIAIQPSPTADSRIRDHAQVTKDELFISSLRHIIDVEQGLRFFRHLLDEAANNHDKDKLADIDGFHGDFITGFKKREWWNRHLKLNRHHLQESDGVPEDVNLIDVLEMIADCVMAGMANKGSVYPLELDSEVLMRAFQNTVERLKANVMVMGDVQPSHMSDQPAPSEPAPRRGLIDTYRAQQAKLDMALRLQEGFMAESSTIGGSHD